MFKLRCAGALAVLLSGFCRLVLSNLTSYGLPAAAAKVLVFRGFFTQSRIFSVNPGYSGY